MCKGPEFITLHRGDQTSFELNLRSEGHDDPVLGHFDDGAVIDLPVSVDGKAVGSVQTWVRLENGEDVIASAMFKAKAQSDEL